MTSDAIAPTVRAIVAGHGDWAAGLVSAVAQITGRGALFRPLSNSGMSGAQLEATLRLEIARLAAPVVFTDLPGGSWTLAVRRVQRDMPSLVLGTGVNLAMLLDFVFHEGMQPVEAMLAATEKGRGAIGLSVGAVPASLVGGQGGH